MIPNNHPVLESIQPCLLDLINSTTSEVLYANEFSGLPNVNLPEELVSIFESDFGLVGTNVLIQLENKMSGVPGGPWYIDSRNSCIYIHNRNFQDIPVYTYEYLANSGELIDISFKTNYVKRNTSGGIHPTVNKDKGMSLTLVSSPILSSEANGSRNFELAHYAADASPTKTPPIIDTEVMSMETYSNQIYTESLYGVPTPNTEALIDMYVQSDKDVKKTQAVFDTTINNARIDAYLKNITLDQLKEESQSIFQQTATNLGITVSELREQLQEAMDSGNLDQYLQRLYKNSYHIFNNPTTSPGYPGAPAPTTVKIHELDLFQLDLSPITLSPQAYAHKSTAYAFYGSTKKQMGWAPDYATKEDAMKGLTSQGAYRSAELFKELKSNNQVVSVLEVGDLIVIDRGDTNIGAGYTSANVTYSQKVTVLVESQSNNYIAPTYRIISDLYTRQLDDPDATLKDVEAHVQSLLHANDEVLEKVITCRMTCVGNPFLASSKVLTIKNVSGIWSGKWYIKKCKHTLNNSGYLCTLDLVLNSTIPSSSAVSTDISGKQSWDTDPSYEISINVTSAEAIYYTTLYDKNSDQDQVDFILRMIQNKTSGEYQDEFNDKGIVVVDHTTSSTTAGLEGQGVGAKYTLDSRVTEITSETRTKYERAAREAVFNNSLTDLMEQKVNENK